MALSDKELEKEKRESKLIIDLRADKNLAKDKDKKEEYIGLAFIFLEDLGKNLNKTSLELDENTPVGVDLWREWLNYPIVRAYLQQFKDEQIENIVDGGLMRGDKNLVGIKKILDSNGPQVNNSNIVLIRLPERKDFTAGVKEVKI
jgi:hypothetical protein